MLELRCCSVGWLSWGRPFALNWPVAWCNPFGYDGGHWSCTFSKYFYLDTSTFLHVSPEAILSLKDLLVLTTCSNQLISWLCAPASFFGALSRGSVYLLIFCRHPRSFVFFPLETSTWLFSCSLKTSWIAACLQASPPKYVYSTLFWTDTLIY